MTLRTDIIAEFMASLLPSERAEFALRDRQQAALDDADDDSELPPISLCPESLTRFEALINGQLAKVAA